MEWVSREYAGQAQWTPQGLPDGVEAKMRRGPGGHYEVGVHVRNTLTSQFAWTWELLTAKRLPQAKAEAPAALAKLLHEAAGTRLVQAETLQTEAQGLIDFADSLT